MQRKQTDKLFGRLGYYEMSQSIRFLNFLGTVCDDQWS